MTPTMNLEQLRLNLVKMLPVPSKDNPEHLCFFIACERNDLATVTFGSMLAFFHVLGVLHSVRSSKAEVLLGFGISLFLDKAARGTHLATLQGMTHWTLREGFYEFRSFRVKSSFASPISHSQTARCKRSGDCGHEIIPSGGVVHGRARPGGVK